MLESVADNAATSAAGCDQSVADNPAASAAGRDQCVVFKLGYFHRRLSGQIFRTEGEQHWRQDGTLRNTSFRGPLAKGRRYSQPFENCRGEMCGVLTFAVAFIFHSTCFPNCAVNYRYVVRRQRCRHGGSNECIVISH